MNWIDRIVKEHSVFEPPLSFWRWSAICAISAVVKDNVYLHSQMFDTYPNIYVMLHADSGMKKGPPVNIAKKLVTNAIGDRTIISGRSSIQGILKQLGTSQSIPGGQIVNGSTAFICSSELSSSIVEDKVATTILTDLYDRSYNVGNWRSLLKMESFDLKNPCITMLTATNEAHSVSFFEKKDIRGGYFARTFIIHETEENRPNSLLVPLEKPIDYKKDSDYLKQLSNLKGPFQSLGSITRDEIYKNELYNPWDKRDEYFSESGLIYELWYRSFKEEMKGVKDPTGTLNRFGASVLKVAMLLSLAEKPELIILPSAMEEAIKICEMLIGNLRKVTMGRADNDESNAQRKITLLNELLSRETHSISQAQLLRKYLLQGTPSEWADAIKSFVDAELARIVMVGNQAVIELTEKSVEELKRFMEGKIK